MDLQAAKFDGWPHVIDTRQFKRNWLENILFPLAGKMERIHKDPYVCKRLLPGKEIVSLFVGESLRTRASFETAIRRLGGCVLFGSESARRFSSMAKGESLEDTITVLNEYGADAIVLRHDQEGGAAVSAAISEIPIINAGDGPGQHPTQALLDLYTIKRYKPIIDGKKIAIIGGLEGNRAACSLVYLSGEYNVTIYFVSPRDKRIKSGIKEYLQGRSVQFFETTDIREVVHEVDVFYQTRTQTNLGTVPWDRRDSSQGYTVIDKQVLNMAKPNSIIGHPLPCTDEIVREEVDSDPRAIYIKTKGDRISQVKCGLFIRMALLLIVISPETAVGLLDS